jgi:hypothetical protein
MAAPILPIPAIPICIGCALPVRFPYVATAGGDDTGLCAREKDARRRSATLSLNAAAAAV